MSDEFRTFLIPTADKLWQRLASVGNHDGPSIESFYSLLWPLVGRSMSGMKVACELSYALTDYAKLSPETADVMRKMFRDYLRALIDDKEVLEEAMAMADKLHY